MYQMIRASAGSGKTFQLSGHFLRQLFLGHSPESILATTFTRKAAGEILGRVLLRLAAAAADGEECRRLAEFLKPAEVTQQRSQQLLAEVTRQLHRLRVCTLDSFFQQVARSLTFELGLTPGWRIVDDIEDHDLRRQAIDEVLSVDGTQDTRRMMNMLAKGRSKRSVRELINDAVSDYYGLYQQSAESAWDCIPQPPRVPSEQLLSAQHALREFCPTLPNRMQDGVTADLQRFAEGDWNKFIETGVAAKVIAGEQTYHRQEIPVEVSDLYQPLIRHVRAELLGPMAQQNRAVFSLMQRFDRAYRRVRLEQGSLGFSDITRLLVRAGQAAMGARMNFRLDSSLHHLLLDEFQDTSPEQWSILRRLTETLASDEQESSFFCV
ncbi:MAG: UvrD-helicase domain-containing protein, partial [Planctomycetaceae bacterium]|nr:UvrD-helicase domain-containing protein [Planctomycetaceae bacterium]